jgi:hypothetical protein
VYSTAIASTHHSGTPCIRAISEITSVAIACVSLSGAHQAGSSALRTVSSQEAKDHPRLDPGSQRGSSQFRKGRSSLAPPTRRPSYTNVIRVEEKLKEGRDERDPRRSGGSLVEGSDLQLVNEALTSTFEAAVPPWGQEVGGSNPPGPTSKEAGHRCFSLFGAIAQALLALLNVDQKLNHRPIEE